MARLLTVRHQQLGGCLAKHLPNLTQHLHRRIAMAAFNAADVGQVEASVQRKLLLRQIELLAALSHILSQNEVPVHAAVWTRFCASSLGTIVIILLTACVTVRLIGRAARSLESFTFRKGVPII